MPAADGAAVDFRDEGGRGDVQQQRRDVGILYRRGDLGGADGEVGEGGVEGAEEPVRVPAGEDDDFGGHPARCGLDGYQVCEQIFYQVSVDEVYGSVFDGDAGDVAGGLEGERAMSGCGWSERVCCEGGVGGVLCEGGYC